MLEVLEDEAAISKAQQRFESVFKQLADEKISVKMGYQGGRIDAEVSWCSKLHIWFCRRMAWARNRHWNGFGIGKPAEGKNVSITCQINFPLRDINRQVAGAFVVDRLGDIYVVHRGKIGGGRKGIGKTLFENNYRGERRDVLDGNRETAVALVGDLSSPHFALQVREFVFEVDRIKGLASSASFKAEPHHGYAFRREFAGKKEYTLEKRIKAECDHGVIVNQLEAALRSRGLRTANDRRDLYTLDSSGRIAAIFEVKTDASTTSLYAGVGQLMLYGVDLPTRPRRVLILPTGADEMLPDRLNKLGIELLTYEWRDEKVVFRELDELAL